MKKNSIFVVVIAVAVLLFGSEKAVASQAGGAAGVLLGFAWVTADGADQDAELFMGSEADLQRKGVWVTYTDVDGALRPTLSVGTETFEADVDANQLQSLSFVVACGNPAGAKRYERILFRKGLVLGMNAPQAANTYAVLINREFVSAGEGQDVAQPESGDAAARRRTRGLALAYAAQSDAYTNQMMKLFGVNASFAMPRIVVAAEEWMEIESKKEAPASGGGGIFGVDIASMMDGDEGGGKKQFTSYSIDVLHDDMETTGGDGVAFQTARSIRNDILEGEVIYAATGGQRRVLTASIVFSQLMKNRADFGTDNRILNVDAEHPEVLDQCTDLYPEAKAAITRFLADSPGWTVQIPQKPVIFLRDKVPAYGTYAWFYSDPQTGRMVGMLPNGLHGASDEVNALGEDLRKEAVDRLTDEARARLQQYTGKEGGVQTFFGAVAGMYVASAGVLDGIGITMEDPSIAALSPEDLLKFIAEHALEHCKEFLEAHSDDYGYSARVGFWGGTTAIVGNLGGADAAKKVADAAWNDIKEKAVADIQQDVAEKAGELAGGGREAVQEAVRNAAQRYANRAQDFQGVVGNEEDAYGFQSDVPGRDFNQEIEPQLNQIVDGVMRG